MKFNGLEHRTATNKQEFTTIPKRSCQVGFYCHSSTIIFSRTMVQHIMQWQDTQDYITCKYTTMRDRGKRTINEQDINKYSGKYILTTK